MSPVAPWRRWPVFRQWLAHGWAPRLAQAVMVSNTHAAIHALSHGADPNQGVLRPGEAGKLEHALVQAARANASDLITALLHYGANVESRGDDMFDHTALATAVLARRWAAAERLVDAGASWNTSIFVLDPGAFAAAMSLGGLDPAKVQPLRTTLEQLVTGEARAMCNYVRSGNQWVDEDPRALKLLSRHRARVQSNRLELALGKSPIESANSATRF